VQFGMSVSTCTAGTLLLVDADNGFTTRRAVKLTFRRYRTLRTLFPVGEVRHVTLKSRDPTT
jgi:hypothetical protein